MRLAANFYGVSLGESERKNGRKNDPVQRENHPGAEGGICGAEGTL